MKLYNYFRNAASCWARIALDLKGISHDIVPMHLLKHGGEELSQLYRALNSDGLVPPLVREWPGSAEINIGP